MTDKYSIERFLHIRNAYLPSFRYDGEQISFLMDTTGTSQVWTLDCACNWPEQLTFFEDRVQFARWSPTDERLVFGKDQGGNERTQLFLLDTSDSTITNLTDEPSAKHMWGVWGPDGNRIAYTSNSRSTPVFDVYVRSVDRTESDRVFEGDGWYVVNDWSPDGEQLLITQFHSNRDQDLYLLDLRSGDCEQITDHDRQARHQYAEFGPSGNDIYFASDRGRDTLALMRWQNDERAFDVIDDGGKWNVQKIIIQKETGRIAYTRNVEGYSKLTVGEIEQDGNIEPLSSPDLSSGVLGGIDFSPDGTRLACTRTAATRNPNVHVIDLTSGDVEQWTRASTAGIPKEMFQSPELIHFESFDGRRIPAFLTLPEQQSDSYPVIVDIHGGPESQRRPTFRSLRQYFLHHGYAMLEPNVRGSSGYGKDYKALDDVRNRIDSVKDIRAGVRWLTENTAVDEDRVVAYGGSYGGFMVLACLSKYPELWAAGVDIVGIANFITFLENTGDWRRKQREAEYGSLEDDYEFLQEISPIHHVDRIQCPLLVMHGENDPRVPVEEAEQIVEKVREQNIPVEKCIFPDEGHGFRKLENRITAYRTAVEFLNKHV